MPDPDAADPPPKLVLGDISTSWRKLNDPLRFVMTYGPAVRRYLVALLGDAHEADEAIQDLFLQVTERGFPTADPGRGRFRDYLKATVRYSARKRSRPRPERAAGAAEGPGLGRDEPDPLEEAWRREWQACVVDQAWRAIERVQRAAGRGNLSYTVLRLTADHPDADSCELAARATELSGHLLTAEAFRKQLSRARRTFAELIVAEVRQTLDGATSAQVREELADLGLLGYVRDYLPAGV